MTNKSLNKRIFSLFLCIIMALGLVPLTANAVTTQVPGATGHNLTDIVTETFTDGYDSTIIVYGTPDAYSSMQYEVHDDHGYFQIPYYDNSQWYFDGWRTWYKGSHSGAGVINSDKANPTHDDYGNYFVESTVGWTSGGKIWLAGTMEVYKESLWKGTYFLSAIFKPIVTVNPGNGVTYTLSSPSSNKIGDNKYGVKYFDDVTINYQIDSKYVLTTATASGTKHYNTSTYGMVILTDTEKPTSVSINTRLKQQKVNFNANGGSGAMATQSFEHSTAQTLTANSFTRSGYTFAGWNTQANGLGTSYTNQQSVTFTPENDGDSLTLYAQWKKFPNAQVCNAPTANNLTYTGYSQELITAGTASGGQMQYSLDENGTYSAAIPTETNAGDYTVYYYVKGDTTHNDSEVQSIPVTIGKAILTVTAEDKNATYGDSVPDYSVNYDGFKNNDNKNDLGGTLAFDCNYVQFADKGEYLIIPKGFTSDNYEFNYVNGKLTVGAKPITVNIVAKNSVCGDEIVTLTATDNGIVNNDADVYKLTTTASKTAGVGKYDITGIALDDNYSITFENGDDAYEITKRILSDVPSTENILNDKPAETNPNTGDAFGISLWLVLMLISAATFGICMILRYRKRLY